MWWPWLCRYLVTCCRWVEIMCFVRRRNSAKVESCSATLLSSFSLLPLLVAQPCLANAPPNTAAPTPESHRISSSVPCMAHPAALPVLCSRRPTAEAKKKSRKLKDILAQDERVVKIGKNWDGRPSRRFIQPKMNVSLRRRPLPKENQKTPAFGRGTRRPPGRTVPPAGSTSEETG